MRPPWASRCGPGLPDSGSLDPSNVAFQLSVPQHGGSKAWRNRVARALAGVALGLALWNPGLARQPQGYDLPEVSAAAGTIAVQQLPNDAQQTLQRIEAGGPFPYEKDGSRFGNYERVLPQQPRGYYREYTVAKSNSYNSRSRNRGARRIVCGGNQRAADDCYYTDDHYNSFKRIIK